MGNFIQRLQLILTPLLLVACILLTAWLGQLYSTSWDWSDNASNSISPTSQQLLQRLKGPLQITAFAPDYPQMRQTIRKIIARYQHHRPDISLDFIDPNKQPALVKELGVKASGELHINYQGRREVLRTIDEEQIGNAIQRLLQQGEHWIVGIQGHGERNISGKANHDLGSFSRELQTKGFHLQNLDLIENPQIPDNTSLLVIAGPSADYLTGELTLIEEYLAAGGNLLWLSDPDEATGMNSLYKSLGVEPLPGTVVDAYAGKLGLDSPAFAVVSQYSDHPITQSLNSLTLYPFTRALTVTPREGWTAMTLLQTQNQSWNETSKLKGNLQRNPEQGEQPGPMTLGITLTRARTNGEQRLAIIGDGDFLSNAYLGNGSNLDLGLNLVRWLTGEMQLLQIPAKITPDRNLTLSRQQLATIALILLIGIPIGSIVTGSLVWWRRRRR